MKIYTYNNSDNNYNNLKNYLNNNAKKAFPWLFSGDYNDTRDFIDTYYGPYTKKNFNNMKRHRLFVLYFLHPYCQTKNMSMKQIIIKAISKIINYIKMGG